MASTVESEDPEKKKTPPFEKPQKPWAEEAAHRHHCIHPAAAEFDISRWAGRVAIGVWLRLRHIRNVDTARTRAWTYNIPALITNRVFCSNLNRDIPASAADTALLCPV